jgi:hypothetical protein
MLAVRQCVTVPQNASWQDETGRLWDVLTLLWHAIAGSTGGQQVNFTVGVQNDEKPPRPVRLKALCGPGDSGEPVITIMLPEETATAAARQPPLPDPVGLQNGGT